MSSEEQGNENWLKFVISGGFSYIAVWQAAIFLLLILLVWVSEVLDLPALLFGVEPSPVDVVGSCMASAGILICGIVTIGNTYLQQRKIIKGFLTICSYCKKIRIQNDAWQRIEEYIATRSDVDFSHGVCPDCFLRVSEMLGKEDSASPDEIGLQT